MLRIFTISFFYSVLFCSCNLSTRQSPLTPRYGIEHNKVRDSIGISLVDTNWVAWNVWKDVTVWGAKHSSFPDVHKQVGYFNDTLYCEFDIYTGKETFDLGEDGVHNACIMIMYFYRPANTGPWDAFVDKDDKSSMGWMYYYWGLGRKKITRLETDSILHSWGYSDFSLGN